MISLPDVNLMCVDCYSAGRAIAAMRVSMREMNFGRAVLLTDDIGCMEVGSPADITVVHIPYIGSAEEYSKFMIEEFHWHLDNNFALVVQWDGFVLNPKAWTDEYLKYDYIGAPWNFSEGNNVGNGGFSLRSFEFVKASAGLGAREFHPEDRILCRKYYHAMRSMGMNFAPVELAARFSIEGPEGGGAAWDGQFGFHSYQLTDISKWKNGESENLFDAAYTDSAVGHIARELLNIHTVNVFEQDLMGWYPASSVDTEKVRRNIMLTALGG